jgi:hypothetical protein
VKYELAREMVRNGDLVAIRSRGTVTDQVISGVLGSPYTHTAVALWMSFDGAERLLVAESNGGGARLVPLSQHAGADFDVFECPTERGAAGRAVLQLLGEPIRYDKGDLVLIAANRLFGVPLPDLDDDRKICSALSASIYLCAGWLPPEGLPSIPAPDDVVHAVGVHPKILVRA